MGRPRAQYERAFPLSREELVDLVLDAADLLGWQLQGQANNTISFSIPMSIWSWGEFCHVTVGEGPVRAVSQSRGVTLVDWGKNSRNLERFFNRLELTANSAAV